MTATRPPGGSVFLVEDEVMIRMMVADMLEELGYSVAAEAGEINEAIRLAQSTEFDLAILDVNVNGKVISPVAELIKARNRPFIFATGYGSSGLPEEYRDRPALQKPFQLETLAQDDRHRAEERDGLRGGTKSNRQPTNRRHPAQRLCRYRWRCELLRASKDDVDGCVCLHASLCRRILLCRECNWGRRRPTR